MKRLNFSDCIVAAAILTVGSPALAGAPAVDVPAAVGGMQSTAKSKQALADKRKTVAKIKPVDINSASAKQLKKLPGIGDAEAARIIAGRPYGSKLWLVTQNVIPEGYYVNIKHLIIAGQPHQNVDKNAALYRSKP